MKRAIVILSVIALVTALPALLSIGVALAQPGGAATPAEYAGAVLMILVSALDCAACLLTLLSAAREQSRVWSPETSAALALTGMGPLALIAALYASGITGFAALTSLFNMLDPTLLWVVICTLALAAPLLALTCVQGWRLAPVARSTQHGRGMVDGRAE